MWWRAKVWSLSWWRTLPPAVCLITLFTLVTSRQTPHPKRLNCTTNHPHRRKPNMSSEKFSRNAVWVHFSVIPQRRVVVNFSGFNNVLYLQYMPIDNKHYKETQFRLGMKLVHFVKASGLFLGWLNIINDNQEIIFNPESRAIADDYSCSKQLWKRWTSCNTIKQITIGTKMPGSSTKNHYIIHSNMDSYI